MFGTSSCSCGMQTFRTFDKPRKVEDWGIFPVPTMQSVKKSNDCNRETVLLRERKRHTTHHIVSTPSVVLPWGLPHPQSRWGVPPSLARWQRGTLSWGTPHLDLAEVTPYLDLDLAGVPPICTWTWLGSDPPVDRQMDGWTDTCQTLPSHRTAYAGGNEGNVL